MKLSLKNLHSTSHELNYFNKMDKKERDSYHRTKKLSYFYYKIYFWVCKSSKVFLFCVIFE